MANRGEIAVRIVRACFDEGLESVVAVSDVDRDGLAASLADSVVVIGPAPAAESYLCIERVVAAALYAGCDALHPGYGFLSERPELTEACEANGITFVGPPAEVMRRSGDKLRARSLAKELGIPTGGGTDALVDLASALEAAAGLGFPLMLKASAGGGGRGMRIVRDETELAAAFAVTTEEARRAFGDGRIYLERYIEKGRHVEVQILADLFGTVCHLGERDCSTQRRHQKLIEEAPAAGLPSELTDAIRSSAVRLGEALGYVGAGTVEFMVDTERGDYSFLELNARVQVEHPVTEMVTGVDIVREQLRIADRQPLSFKQEEVGLDGHSIECRINAEDPAAGFLPSPGTVEEWVAPQGCGVRVETHMLQGATIPPYYDSMVAKLVVHAADRASAIDLALRALARFRVGGVATTIALQQAILGDADFAVGPVTTRWLEEQFLTRWKPTTGTHQSRLTPLQ